MLSKRGREGWLMIDHRAVQAAPVPGQVPSGTIFESATVTCSHCQAQIVLNPDRSRERGYCPKCDHYVCDRCEVTRVASGECQSVAKLFDQLQEAAARGNTPLPLLTAAMRKDAV